MNGTNRIVAPFAMGTLVVAVAALATPACGGSEPPAASPATTPGSTSGPTSGTSTPSDPSTTGAGAATPGTANTNAPVTAPLSTVLTTDPNQLSQMYAAAASAATASAQPGASGDPLDAGLKDLASKQAAGMAPDGPAVRGTLQQGGHLEMLITLQAGKCYSILGFSPSTGVKDLDLHLLSPPLYNILSGEDTTDDNLPVVGKPPTPMCPAVGVNIPYKVDIYADKGGGPVAVQLYSKAK
jgi:hypothetical protein